MRNSTCVLLVALLCSVPALAQKTGKTPDSPKDSKSTTVNSGSSGAASAASKPAPPAPSYSPPPPPPSPPAYEPAVSRPSGSGSGKNSRTDIRPTAAPQPAVIDTSPAIEKEPYESEASATEGGEEPLPEEEVPPGTDTEDPWLRCIPLSCLSSPSWYFYECNFIWYSWWYTSNQGCAWAGDVTFVNATESELRLYVEEHDAEDVPVVGSPANSPVQNSQLLTNLMILPGDSLTFKMPCGALKYEAVENKNNESDYQAYTIGWVRTVSYDVRVEIRPEDLN